MNVTPTTVICVECGEEFDTKRPGIAMYCSDRCKDRVRFREGRKKSNPEYQRRWWDGVKADPERHAKLRATENLRTRKLKDWINEYKLAQGCIDCGYREHAVALDFDHMDGKTANICNLKSVAAVMAEIERHDCVVRCANCHRVKSLETKTWER